MVVSLLAWTVVPLDMCWAERLAKSVVSGMVKDAGIMCCIVCDGDVEVLSVVVEVSG